MKIKNNKHIISFLFALLFTLVGQVALAQDDQKLGDYYYNKGEFDKAEVYYAKIVKKYESKSVFEKYVNCLTYQNKFDEAEKAINKKIRKDRFDITYQFMLANVYELTDRQDEANGIYNFLIDDLAPIQSRINALGKAFIGVNKYDYALKTYLKGQQITKAGYQFNLELADLYARLNQPEKMIQEYLNLLDYSATYLSIVQTYLSRNIDFESEPGKVDMLKNELLLRIQKHPSKTYYNEMLIWLYLQRKEFSGAVIQAKALDKRTDNNGRKVYEIGLVCMTNKSYDNARKAFKYVINLGDRKPYYQKAIQNNLESSFLELTEGGRISKPELEIVAQDYESALEELGKSNSTVEIIERLAIIYAFYLNQPKKAEVLIKESLKMGVSDLYKAKLSVLLGDIYVVDNRIWDASILYMQVSKDFSEEPIGHEAKFKNAKVFFYDGEFEYAKAQLDVLKASTSKLIANDAMQLSLLLQDNLGIDTTQAPIKMYAKADLLLQQNQFQSALTMLDSIEKEYPFHAIIDEINFKKGEIYEKMQNWEKAIEFYNIVVTNYSFDILADDAVYRIARIYELRLNNPDKAAEYYKKILFEFSGSLYTAESREKFRKIKGV